MSESKAHEGARGVDILRVLLIIGAILLLVIGVGAAAMSAILPNPGTSEAASIFQGVVVLLACAIVALSMLAMASGLRILVSLDKHAHFASKSSEWVQQTISALDEKIVAMPDPSNAASPIVTPSPAPQDEQTAAMSQQTIDMLIQVRDLLLMNDEQRAEHGKQHWEARQQYLRKVIEQQIAAGDWNQAERYVQELHAVTPDDPSVETLARRIDDEQNRRMQLAVAAAREKIRHFMSITAWPQAEEVVADLIERFPHSAEAAGVAGELRQEREAFDRETIQRLFLDLKDATDHRQWRRAYQTAEELLRRYPREKKVERLAADIGTIKENAESQERREQEELFKDLLKRQRYEEAFAVAHAVINKYPASTAAAELNRLLPKVEELIRQAQSAKQAPPV
jgi:hypothetical protein